MYRGLQRPSSVFCCCKFRTYLRVNGSRTCTISVFRYQRKTKGKSYAPSFWVMWPTLNELISATTNSIDSKSFLEERYMSIFPWKNYAVLRSALKKYENRSYFFPLGIFPKTCMHLPEDREIQFFNDWGWFSAHSISFYVYKKNVMLLVF